MKSKSLLLAQIAGLVTLGSYRSLLKTVMETDTAGSWFSGVGRDAGGAVQRGIGIVLNTGDTVLEPRKT